MEYRVTWQDEPKPLADFYDGECFEANDEDGESLFMCVGGCTEEQTPRTNRRACYNFYTGEVTMWNDSIEMRPVWVDIERLGE